MQPAVEDLDALARHDGRVHLMLRVQSRGRKTFLMMAHSDDGVEFSLLRETWQQSWESLGNGSNALVEPINDAIDAHRMTVLDTLKALR